MTVKVTMRARFERSRLSFGRERARLEQNSTFFVLACIDAKKIAFSLEAKDLGYTSDIITLLSSRLSSLKHRV